MRLLIQLGHQPRRLHEKATALPAALAALAHESMRRDAAFQVGAQLLLDMARQLLLGRARALQEGLQMSGERQRRPRGSRGPAVRVPGDDRRLRDCAGARERKPAVVEPCIFRVAASWLRRV